MSKQEAKMTEVVERLKRLADQLDALVERRTRRMDAIDAARDSETEAFEAAAKEYLGATTAAQKVEDLLNRPKLTQVVELAKTGSSLIR